MKDASGSREADAQALRSSARSEPQASEVDAVAPRSGARSEPKASEADAAARLVDGRAFADYLARIAAAGEHIRQFPIPNDDPDLRAQGYRYLLGLVTSGIAQALELSDPDQPRFVRNPDSRAKWGAENADNQYLWARVRPDAVYRIEGERRGEFELLFELKDGYMQLGDERVFVAKTASDLGIAQGTRFELLLSAERPAAHTGPWLPLHPESRYVAVRQYFVDWEREQPARLEIFRVGGEADAPAKLTAARMAELLSSAGEWTEASAKVWSEWTLQMRAAHVPGRVHPARHFAGGAPDIFYGNDLFRLAPGEALIFETELPDARYWQVQLCDVWFETLDYAGRQTSLNHAQLHIDDDRRARVVVAHEDPGVANWLDSCGQVEGMLQYRWIWTRSNPQPRVRVVPFSRLAEELPATTRRVSPAERRATIAARKRHLLRREPLS